jgi:hypothetical protein
MNQEQINKQIFRRIEKLEKRVFDKDAKSDHGKKEQGVDSRTSLPSLILKLRDGGFFKQPQSANDVYKKLSPTYSCKLDRVNMALKRLKERKKLRIADKIIKGKKVLAYVW